MGAQYLLCFSLLSTFYLHIERRVCSLTINNGAPHGLKISQTFLAVIFLIISPTLSQSTLYIAIYAKTPNIKYKLKKINLFLSVIKSNAMKMFGGLSVKLHSSLTSALGEW
jgi:hypothetical protein